MSWIFVSYSSQDRAAVEELRDRLKDRGYEALFLDFDPDDGIKPGRDWEKQLYQRLRHCGAAIVLCSESSLNTGWCFAEVTQARAYEKPLFALKIDGCRVEGILGNIQVIDMTLDHKEDGYRRLWDALLACGLDPRDSFRWDPRCPPYPGMLAFGESDAGVFFGRERKVREVLNTLEKIRQDKSARLALIVGPSGSGKSSLALAGVIPRLKRETSLWSVKIAPPRSEAMTDELLQIPPSSADGPEPSSVLLFVDQIEERLTSETELSSLFLDRLRRFLQAPGSRTFALVTMRADFLGRFLKSPLGDVPHSLVTLGPIPRDRFREIIEGPAAWADIDSDDKLVEQMINDTGTEDSLPLLAFTLRELYEDCQARHQRRFTFAAYNNLGGIAGAVGEAALKIMTGAGLGEEGRRDLRRAFLKLVDIQPDSSFVRRRATWNEIPEGAKETLEEFIRARLITRGEGGTVWINHDALFRVWPELSDWLDNDREFQLWRKRIDPKVKSWIKTSSSGLLLRDDELVEATKWCESRSDDLNNNELRMILYSKVRKKGEDDALEAQRQRELQNLQNLAALSEARRRLLASFRVALAAACLATVVALVFFRNADLKRIDAEDARKRSNDLTKQVIKQRQEAENQTRIAEKQARVEYVLRLEYMAGSQPPENSDKAVILISEAIHFARSHNDPPEGRIVSELYLTLAGSRQRVLFKYPEPIVAAALALKGQRFAALGPDGSLQVRDRGRSEPLVKFPGSRADASMDVDPRLPFFGSVALSEEGGVVATGAIDGSIRVCFLNTPGTSIRNLLGNNHPAASLAFSPDGRFLAAGGTNGQARVWDLKKTDLPPISVGEDMVPIHNIAISVDGRRLATGSDDGKVRVWELSEGQQEIDKKAQIFDQVLGGSILVLLMSRDGKRLFTGGANDSVLIRNLDSPSERPISLRGQRAPVIALSVNESGSKVAGTCIDGSLYMWNLGEPKTTPFSMHGGRPAIALAIDAEGNNITYIDEYVCWQVSADSPPTTQRFQDHEGPVLSVAGTSDGTQLASGSKDGTVRLWNTGLPTSKPRILVRGQAAVNAVALNSQGSQLIAGNDEGSILSWDLNQAAPAARNLASHKGPVRALALAANGTILASGGDDETVRVWDLSQGATQAVHELSGHEGSVRAVAISTDGAIVASGGDDRVVRVWRLSSGAPPRLHKLIGHNASVRAVALTPDGAKLASGGDDGTLHLWDLKQNRHKIVNSKSTTAYLITALTIGGPGPGYRLVAGCAIASVGTLPGAIGRIESWNLSNLENNPIVVDFGFAPNSLAIPANGKRLMLGTQDGMVYSVTLDLDELLGIAEKVAGRNLTPEEWLRDFPETPYHKTFADLP